MSRNFCSAWYPLASDALFAAARRGIGVTLAPTRSRPCEPSARILRRRICVQGLNPAIIAWCDCWGALTGTIRALLRTLAAQMVLGAVVSGFVAVILDWLRRPKLTISIGEPPLPVKTVDAEGNILENYTAVRALAANTRRWPRWWPRQTLIRASALITFHDPRTGADLFNRSMRGRWASLPQPEIMVLVEGKKTLWADPALIANVPEIDIPWGEVEPLDIAVRFQNDSDAYGWSNDSYYDQQKRYRPERWRLPLEGCLVRAIVQGSGERCSAVYRLVNSKEGGLRLVSATRAEKALLS